MDSSNLSLLLLFLFLFLLPLSSSQPGPPRSFFLNCGATTPTIVDGVRWDTDGDYISEGTPRSLSSTNGGSIDSLLHPSLSTLRSFSYRPSDGPRKFCYYIPTYAHSNYLLRTTFFYDGDRRPPTFDLVADGTIWAVVNTTDDRARGLASYYEGVYDPPGKTFSLCVAGNPQYTDSDPFVSSIELFLLPPSMYNSTDFTTTALVLVGRNNFGYDGRHFGYPDDQYNRYWQPFGDSKHDAQTSQDVSVSGLWNLPPSKIFQSHLAAEIAKPLEMHWPLVSLPNASYYIALYFADPLSNSSRVFDIYLNGIPFYESLSVSPSAISVFATNWPLSGSNKLLLVPSAGSGLPPMINGGEIFGILNLSGVTVTRDVIAIEDLREDIKNPPSDWEGDPCLPRLYKWTGITCTETAQIRVTSVNLTGMDLSGNFSSKFSRLTALTGIFVGDNNFSGPIPDLSRLRLLERLHLQNNHFNGPLPASIGELDYLRELYVENNDLTGPIPDSIRNKAGLDFRYYGTNLY